MNGRPHLTFGFLFCSIQHNSSVSQFLKTIHLNPRSKKSPLKASVYALILYDARVKGASLAWRTHDVRTALGKLQRHQDFAAQATELRCKDRRFQVKTLILCWNSVGEQVLWELGRELNARLIKHQQAFFKELPSD